MTALRLADSTPRTLVDSADEGGAKHPPITEIARSALAVVALGAIVLSGWAYLVPLSGGVVATGTVAVEANRRSVQSRDGGTIDVLHVKEGSVVEKGDVVVSFDPVEVRANHAVVDHQYLRALAKHARLSAEVDKRGQIDWPDELTGRSDERLVTQLMEHETELLRSNAEFLDGRNEILKSRIAELRNQAEAIKAQITGFEEQVALTRAEEKDVASLVERGFERRPRLLELRRDLAEHVGEVGSLRSSLAGVLEAIQGALREQRNLTHEHLSRVFSELTEAEGMLAELADRRRGTVARLQGTELRAPESGTVVNLQYFGPGAVVGAGQPVFDLVPTPDAMLVRAKVRPEDIDAVRMEQPAQVRVLAYNQHYADPLPGHVSHVSADRLTDRNGENPHYEVFVAISPDVLDHRPEISLQSGMPVDVVLTTEERSFFEYLLSPITRAIFLGFREE